jgi:hypothetical protein
MKSIAVGDAWSVEGFREGLVTAVDCGRYPHDMMFGTVW